MDRRHFLVGLGAFAGALAIPKPPPTIFDMGRDLILPPPDMQLDLADLAKAKRMLEWYDKGIISTHTVFDLAGGEGDYSVTMTLEQFRAFTELSGDWTHASFDPLTPPGMVRVWQRDLLRHVLEPRRIDQLALEPGRLQQPDDRAWAG